MRDFSVSKISWEMTKISSEIIVFFSELFSFLVFSSPLHHGLSRKEKFCFPHKSEKSESNEILIPAFLVNLQHIQKTAYE